MFVAFVRLGTPKIRGKMKNTVLASHVLRDPSPSPIYGEG